MFGQFRHNIYAYGPGSTKVSNYTFEGNVLLDNSNVIGGYASSSDMIFHDNFVYAPGREALEFGYPEYRSNHNAAFTGNVFAGDVRLNDWNKLTVTENLFTGSSIMLTIEIGHDMVPLPDTYKINNNRYYYLGQSSRPFLAMEQKEKNTGNYTSNRLNFQGWQERLGADRNSTYQKGAPGGFDVYVRPNKYEDGRGHIIIFNWNELPKVPVDLSSLGLEEGQAFEIRDAENYFGSPVYRGQYTREEILLPVNAMELSEMYGRMSSPYTHTPLEMGVYVIMPMDE